MKTVALLGNPNVGKSSLFNRITGLKRHTGNWTGKTVDCGLGKCKGYPLYFADLPGTYSLTPKSAEEEVSEDFIIFENPQKTVVVADATCLMRTSLILFELLEITNNVVLCINLCDTAKKQGVSIDAKALSEKLNIPVIMVSARKGSGISELLQASASNEIPKNCYTPRYTNEIEASITRLMPYLENDIGLPQRWLALRLLSGDFRLFYRIKAKTGMDFLSRDGLWDTLDNESHEKKGDIITRCRVLCCEEVIEPCVKRHNSGYRKVDALWDRMLTGKGTSTAVMLILLALIFWLTLSGANSISSLLSVFFNGLEDRIYMALTAINTPDYIALPLCDGILHTLFKVISVMTPPMAIFFPLFTILEDLGYLPRVAFNLDRHFKKCSSCGKQAYSMCMGFGCNAAGVMGARIIDSPRERLLAILTNSLVPCNGKFPALTLVITMFLVFFAPDNLRSVLGSLLLTGLVLLSVAMTFFVTKFLSKTLLKGRASSFVLELPPYRKPEPCKILVRSFLDRGVFLILRATVAAAPCGLLVWCLANLSFGDKTLLLHFADFLEPLGRLMGMDGTILLAFILGLPANEIVIPLIITGYSALGTVADDTSLTAIRTLFLENGWTTVTAVNVTLFMLFHWPCATTLMTIKKETKSLTLTALAFLIPTIIGFTLCVLINLIF